jgi:hypothetical protein
MSCPLREQKIVTHFSNILEIFNKNVCNLHDSYCGLIFLPEYTVYEFAITFVQSYQVSGIGKHE